MGVYIKGMEMPRKTGIVSIVLAGDGSALLCEDGTYSEIEVIPVPPHGRLIDVDLADDDAYDELELANNYRTGWEAARAMQKIYRNAPTIIPADKEGEG